MHLPRLLSSVEDLQAQVYILDSGSTDGTLTIANNYGAVIYQHPFENHPRQWDYALNCFPVTTPWVICLDADQMVTPELKELLLNFNPVNYAGIDGVYFNRKNIFKGKWLKHGGYYPFYLLKMFRYNIGYSDLGERMDHRFVVPGKSIIWKKGHIIEENLKENEISFWISKHNRYSDLLAQEEIERLSSLLQQTERPYFWGSPNERKAWFKKRWWKLPRYVRPALYFFHRYFIKLGFLDGRTGTIFHFMQAFWFRLVVDIKIDELLKKRNEQG